MKKKDTDQDYRASKAIRDTIAILTQENRQLREALHDCGEEFYEVIGCLDSFKGTDEIRMDYAMDAAGRGTGIVYEALKGK